MDKPLKDILLIYTTENLYYRESILAYRE